VHVIGGRQPGPDVEELPDARLGGQVPDDPAEELAVFPQPGAAVWPCGERLVRRRAVSGEMVLAADVVVVTSISATGWLKSRTSLVAASFRITAGSRRSAWIYAVRPSGELASSARACASTSGSLST
jgi:hypothetical protein